MSEAVREFKELEGLKRSLKLSIPSEVVDAEVTRLLKQKQKTAQMPGFRRGRAPISLIDRKYGADARSDAAMELIRSLCKETLQEKSQELASRLQIVELSDEGKGQELSATVEFEVYPDFRPAPLAELQVEEFEVVVEDGDIEKFLKGLQAQATTYSKVDRASEDADCLTLRLSVQTGQAPAAGAAEADQARDMQAIVGAGRFPDEVEQTFTGVKAGEQRQVSVQQPGAEDANAVVNYDFEVLEVAAPRVPPLEELAAPLIEGQDDKGDISALEILRERAHRQLQEQGMRSARRRTQQAVVHELLEANAGVPLPQQLLDDECRELYQGAARQLQMEQSALPETIVQSLREQGERRIRFSLLLRELMKEHDIEPKPQELGALAEDEARGYGERAEDFYVWAMGNEDYQRQLRARALESNAVDLILQQAVVSKKTVPLSEIEAEAGAKGAEK